MIRRQFIPALAVLALGLFMAPAAQAGGASSGAVGVKKNANIRIKNTTATPYYVVVVPSTLQVPQSAYQAQRLGAYLLNPGKTVTYPVPAGKGRIYAQLASAIPADPNAPLPPPAATSPEYNVAKGKVQNATLAAGPVITLP